MKPALVHAVLMFAIAGVASSTALAAGDAAKGEKVFSGECSDCHSVTAGKNKKGPSLNGVNGRKAATVAAFAYSDAMKASDITWSPEKIDAYITKPKKVVPGGKMKYDGLDDEKDRADVIAYLLSLH
ncbi:MAG: cytochrome c family protein [Betaproteobacteria bacterium]|nr:cytochrome c family protein [Betaproteobacteria bacterium]NCA24589.1 cytochrome c family protein [Betaproteobacteria bacterium]